ncbi:MAG: alpha/beta hydrolase [Actinomycetota bacterium]
MEPLQIDVDGASLEVDRYASSGPLVCLLPGLGGGIRRFADLGRRLADAGHQPIAVNPRGAGASTGSLDGLRLGDLAGDLAGVIDEFGGPAVVVGNAYGNRVARYLAATRPDLVTAVVLVCAGGEVPPDPEAARSLGEFLDESLDADRRLDAARRALFAPGNEVDPTFIDPGRSVAAARAQMAAVRAEPSDGWLAGGAAPMLVVQGVEDRIAPPANGHRLRDRWPDRVEVVDVADAGHAILNEQPDAVAEAILDFLSRCG